MSDGNRALLFGSESLTSEEERLRAALIEWCQGRLDEGARPVPLHAALVIVADMVSDARNTGFKVGYNTGGWQSG
ncbi:MAG: hypothetical protein LCH92_01375 [Proteobacteria bacterium]|nr:hypothetical protein [Pseudomonadota bacterium]